MLFTQIIIRTLHNFLLRLYFSSTNSNLFHFFLSIIVNPPLLCWCSAVWFPHFQNFHSLVWSLYILPFFMSTYAKSRPHQVNQWGIFNFNEGMAFSNYLSCFHRFGFESSVSICVVLKLFFLLYPSLDRSYLFHAKLIRWLNTTNRIFHNYLFLKL